MDDGIYLPFHADFSFTFPIQRYITDIATRHFFKRKKKNKKIQFRTEEDEKKERKGEMFKSHILMVCKKPLMNFYR